MLIISDPKLRGTTGPSKKTSKSSNASISTEKSGKTLRRSWEIAPTTKSKTDTTAG